MPVEYYLISILCTCISTLHFRVIEHFVYSFSLFNFPCPFFPITPSVGQYNTGIRKRNLSSIRLGSIRLSSIPLSSIRLSSTRLSNIRLSSIRCGFKAKSLTKLA